MKYLQGNEPDVLLISVTQQVAVKEVFQSFLLLMEQVDLHLMVSPTRIHLGSINGEIDEFYAGINGIKLKPREGSAVELIAEGDDLKIQRIYLDFMYEDKRAIKILSEKDLEAFLKKYLSVPVNPKKYS
ncbi:MAG TPA: hypothetical protein DCM01_08615 [Dielma fastidiosa]|nr:hypothetical protein [Dielma fastidiosa]